MDWATVTSALRFVRCERADGGGEVLVALHHVVTVRPGIDGVLVVETLATSPHASEPLLIKGDMERFVRWIQGRD